MFQHGGSNKTVGTHMPWVWWKESSQAFGFVASVHHIVHIHLHGNGAETQLQTHLLLIDSSSRWIGGVRENAKEIDCPRNEAQIKRVHKKKCFHKMPRAATRTRRPPNWWFLSSVYVRFPNLFVFGCFFIEILPLTPVLHAEFYTDGWSAGAGAEKSP